jgi:ketosteroid isomerase-like protein
MMLMQRRPVMRIIFVTATALLMSCAPAGDETAGEEAEGKVIELEHQWVDAALAGNVESFAAFMTDDYVVVSDGHTTDKRTWVDAVRSGRHANTSVELLNLKVHLYGNTAVVNGDYTQSDLVNGQEKWVRGVYVTTWVRRNGRWQAVASGFSDLPDP